jgi:hypothetical protein
MHLVHTRRLSCPDIDDGSLQIDKVEFSEYPDSTHNAVQRLTDYSRPNLACYALHVDADQSLARSADRLRNFVVAEDRRC